MDPVRQRELFKKFLESAVAEYSEDGGSLTIFAGSPPPFLAGQEPWGHARDSDLKHFEQLLGTSAREGVFSSLTTRQCEIVLDEIIRNRALIPGVILTQSFRISCWLIQGQRVPAESWIMLYYGMKPCMATFLEFETVDQFEFVKKVLADLKFCKLNEKHLKVNKRAARTSEGKKNC